MNLLLKTILSVVPFLSISAVEPAPKPKEESVVIMGGGIGSLTSAIYLGRAGISPLVIEGPLPGGLLTQSHSVGNWPGEQEIAGSELTEKIRRQAEANGARFLKEEVIEVDFSKRPFSVTTRALDGSKKIHHITAESCIIATGTKPNYLGVPGEQSYWGHGVTNCAICDGSLYKGKVVGVVGGGDAAIAEALYLSNIAKEVHVFVRKDALRANEEKRVALLREKPNVHFHFETTVEEVKGNAEGVTGVVLKTGSKKRAMPLDGLFLAIGSKPNSKIFQGQLQLDEKGYVVLTKDQETSTNGVYAIGDVADPDYKQAISAAGDGAKAALKVQQYLSDRANHLVKKEEAAPAEEPAEEIVSNQEIVAEVIEISSAEHFQDELNSDIPVMVDFYATWCGPCKKVSPLLENSAAQLAGRVKFLKVNVDKVADVSNAYKVKAMPTLVLFDSSGKETERKIGFDEIADLLHQLNQTGD